MTHDSISPFEQQLAQRAQQLDLSPPPGMAEHILMAAASTRNASPSHAGFLPLQRGMIAVAAVLLVLATSIVGTAIAGHSILSPGLRDTMSSWLSIDAGDVPTDTAMVEATDQGVTVRASGVFNNGVLVAIAVEAYDPTQPGLVHQINVGRDDATGEFAQTSLRTEDGQTLQFAGLAADPNEYSRMLVLYGTVDGEPIEAEDFVLDIVGAKRYASNQLVDDVDGEWTLRLSVPRTEETQNLNALAPASVGPVEVTFGAFKHSESFIGGSIRLSAATPEDLAPAATDDLSGAIDPDRETVEAADAERAEADAAESAVEPGVDVPDPSGERAPGIVMQLYGPDGEFVNPIYTSGFPSPGEDRTSAEVVAFWPRGEAGTYRLVISYDSDTSVEWTLQVP